MKALLIEFNGRTGKRAGNIQANDPGLQCYGWQNLDTTPCKEIRLIEDGRDVSQYEGIPGVTVLHDDVEIDAAIDQHMSKQYRYTIADEALFRESCSQKAIDLSQYRGRPPASVLEDLHERQGVVGISKVKVYNKMSEMPK